MASTNQLLEEIRDAVTAPRGVLRHLDTGTGTTFLTLNPRAAFKLLEIRFKTAALAAAETLSFTRTSTLSDGQLLDYVNYLIYSNDLGTAGTTDLSVAFDGEEGYFTKDDSIVPALSANTGSDRWGLEIVYELI